jgi:hypothetical protein
MADEEEKKEEEEEEDMEEEDIEEEEEEGEDGDPIKNIKAFKKLVIKTLEDNEMS